MIPRKIGEIISASRKTAKEFKQVLEDIAELIREKQLQESLSREPVRVPVRPQNHQHPLAGRASRRHFSTYTTRNPNFKNLNRNFVTKANLPKSNIFTKPSISNTLRAAIYQTQPFRTNTRAQLNFIRGGIGSGMYSHFPRHNARMFSTYGPNLTHLAVKNLSQGIRTLFVKGGKVGSDCLTNVNVGSLHSTKLFVENDMKLASMVSETTGLKEDGCFVEFDLSTPSIVSFVPEEGYFDDDLSVKLQDMHEASVKLQANALNDVKLFRENIGSTIYKFDRNRDKLRFYCPNCNVLKMEGLLQDCGISTGIVKKLITSKDCGIDNSSSASISSSIMMSDSDFSGPDLESDNQSVLSSLDEDFETSDRILNFESDYSYIDDSILSTSDEYLSVSYAAIHI